MVGSAALVKECNGRKSQHVHILTYGSVAPRFVSLVAEDAELRQLVLSALDTQVGSVTVGWRIHRAIDRLRSQMSAEMPWSHHVVDRLRQHLKMRQAPLSM